LKYAYVGGRSYKTVIVLMDSTDPNNSINQTLAEYKTEEVVNGAKYFVNITSASAVTFVFTEANRKLAAKVKKHILDTKKNYDFKIKFIPNKYPLDNPYILTNLVCGKKIKKGSSFLDAGITIESAEACYNFCRAVEFNKPVFSKIVTVDGSNVSRPGNYIVPNGFSYQNIIDAVGVENHDAKTQLIDGNLLCGVSQYNTEISLSSVTETIMLMQYDILNNLKEHPCISCGKCVTVCPMFLNPTRLDDVYQSENYALLEKLNVHSCIECGCCSYVCPSKRYLTQRIAASKFYDRQRRNRG
jgi:electron transport complex protein RnfC